MRDIEGVIGRMGGQGDGVLDRPEGRYYVPFTVPGDEVHARMGKPRGDGHTATLIEVVRPGQDRVDAPCLHFHACGGCQLQHWAAEPYVVWKTGLVRAALARRDLDPAVVAPLHAVPAQERRRVDLVARRLAKGVVLGLHERDSGRIVDMRECHVVQPALVALLDPVRALLADLLAPGAGADVLMLASEAGVDLALGGLPGSAAQRVRLASFADQHDLARLTLLPDDVVVRRRAPVLRFGPVAVTPPPGGFVQASAAAEAILAAVAVEAFAGAKRIADLFSGAGTFSLPLAAIAPVQAVDDDPPSLAALRQAADQAGLGSRVQTLRRDLFRRPLTAAELNAFDAVIFDPPRAGAREQAEQIAASKVRRVAAISCYPTSFARDARILVDAGFRLELVQPVDQFRFTPHVELAAVLAR